MLLFRCPKCTEEEISVVERTKRKNGSEIYVKCQCHICDHKFTLIFYPMAWKDDWKVEKDEIEF